MTAAWLRRLARPPLRAPALALGIVAVVGIAYAAWAPGEDVTTGRDSRRRNAVWMPFHDSESAAR